MKTLALIRSIPAQTDGNIISLDIDLINGEEVLVYCTGGKIRLKNLTTGVSSTEKFVINGMECTKGGVEIVHNQQTNKFSIISAVSYRGLHAIVELALPSNPRITNVSIKNGNSSITDRTLSLNITGEDPNEPLSHYCIKYNDSTAPLKSDSCWKSLDISNSLSINNYEVEAKVGAVSGDYEVFVFLKDLNDEVSGISNDQNGVNGIDKVTVSYSPQTNPVINNFIVTTVSSAKEMNLSNTRDTTKEGGIDRYYISWKLDEILNDIEITLDVTFNGVDFLPISSGLEPETVGCANGFSGCFTWTNVSNFISTYVPGYLQNTPFKVRLTITSFDGRKFSMMSGTN